LLTPPNPRGFAADKSRAAVNRVKRNAALKEMKKNLVDERQHRGIEITVEKKKT